MKRREFITLLGGAAAAWPLAARAQQAERMRRIGVLMYPAADDAEGQARLAAFTQALKQLGWSDGRNLRIDTRWATADDIRRHAAELAALAPDVLVAATGTATVAPLLQATRTVPIVFVTVIDPVGAGFVASLARPGGNATGFTIYEYSMSGKWLELLKEIAPRVTRAAVLRDPAVASGIGQFGAVQIVAPSLGVELSPVDVRDAGEIERAVAAFASGLNGGLIVTASASANVHRDLIATLAARHKLPAVYPGRFYVTAGGLISYGRSDRPVPPRGRLRRSHPQGREAGRPAGAGADQIRAGHQPQDRQGARPHLAAGGARPRRRGDRIATLFAHCMSPLLAQSGHWDRFSHSLLPLRWSSALGVAMRRREFITFSVAAVQLGRSPRMHSSSPVRCGASARSTTAAADDADWPGPGRCVPAERWNALGWTERHNVRIDIRWACGDADRIRKHAAELVALRPDVILATGSATGALLQATRTVPIVFVLVPDPVGAGFVDSLARPGGNATGFINFEFGMAGNGWSCSKRLCRA